MAYLSGILNQQKSIFVLSFNQSRLPSAVAAAGERFLISIALSIARVGTCRIKRDRSLGQLLYAVSEIREMAAFIRAHKT